MKTILISNRKGGSGKSTTAVNLAVEFSKKHSTLLIDFDTQGHASIGVGLSSVEENGSHSIFLNSTLSATFRPTICENLTLSPALEFFDVYEYSDISGILKNRFKKEKINDFFEYCIIDTAPTYDSLLKNALEVSDIVIIPVVPHYLGIVGVEQMFRAIYQMSLSVGKKPPKVFILPVMYNPHINEHKESLKKLIENFGEDKLFSPIGTDIHLATQFEYKTPSVLSNKRSKGSNDYKKFAQELLDKLKGS
ncbi:MAG: ParA family protein [Campylobacterales bacterium]|nr:ParA family protein [Campylobacterales bacterium]